MPHLLRSDARDNRDRVLRAARELFAESGLEVTMRQVARRAGVGPATLYRRFPAKQDLILAAFGEEFGACTAIVRKGAADPDPWRGFCGVIERITVLNARNQGFTDAFLAAYPQAIDVGAHRAEMAREITAISRRAIAAGDLRADFTFDDFVLVLLAGRGLSRLPAAGRARAARRFAAIVLEGLRASGTSRRLPPPVHIAASIIEPGFLRRTRPDSGVITEIVDDVFLPLVRP